MAANIKHQFESQIADGADATLLRPSDWNNEHKAEGGNPGEAIVWDPSDAEQSLGWARFDHFNYLFNSDFELWGGGNSAVPSGWRDLNGPGAVITRNTTTSDLIVGTSSLQVERDGADIQMNQDVAKVWKNLDHFKGKTVTFGCWIKCSTAGIARVELSDGVGGNTVSSFHNGDGAFHFIKVARTIDTSATKVEAQLRIVGGDGIAIFAAAIVAISNSAAVSDWSPDGWMGRSMIVMCGSKEAQIADTTEYYGPWGKSSQEVQVSFHLPYAGVAKNLRTLVDGAVPGNVAVTFRMDEVTDTPLAHVISSGRAGSDTSNHVNVPEARGVSVRCILAADAGTRYVHTTFQFVEMPAEF